MWSGSWIATWTRLPTADIRHILVKAELTQEDDPATEDVDESTIPTDEAMEAAKAKAEDILSQWEAGDKTAESFGALAEEYSDDTGSALQRRPVHPGL